MYPGIRFHLNYKTPPSYYLWEERRTPKHNHVFSEVPRLKGTLLLCFFWSLWIILLGNRSVLWDDRMLVLHYSNSSGMVKLPKWSIVKLCTSSARMHMSDSALESPWWVEIIYTLVSEVLVSYVSRGTGWVTSLPGPSGVVAPDLHEFRFYEIVSSFSRKYTRSSALERKWWLELNFGIVSGSPISWSGGGSGEWRHGRVPAGSAYLIFVFCEIF